MVVFGVYVSAELENVARIEFPNDIRWFMDFQQSDGSDVREGIAVSQHDQLEIPGSRGVANLLLKFEGMKKPGYLNFVNHGDVNKAGYEGTEGEPGLVAAVECRGIEPVACRPSEGYRVVDTAGKIFADVDLSDGEWVDYDEENSLSVGVYNIKFEFRVLK